MRSFGLRKSDGGSEAAMKILVLEGDAIGPEICAATVACLQDISRARNLGLEFETAEIGFAGLKKHGSTISPAVFERAKAADGVILGPVSTAEYPPVDKGGINPSAFLRKGLDLYANVRPSRVRPGIPAMAKAMDLVVMRENTEGFYADRNMHQGIGEFMPTPDLALSIRKISAHASRRIAESAFRLARTRRRKVTVVHKANVLKVTEALFLREVRAVAQQHKDVACDEQLVDSMAALLVRDAARFDVVVTTNMFGDILSDEAAELSGSLGLAGSINAGDAHCMAQAQHGSAPDIAGKDLANPVSLLLSSGMLLGWLGEKHGRKNFIDAQGVLETALAELLRSPATRTKDLGGQLGTRAFGAAIMEKLG
jgi:3-isopropylmalate dehydrogenase